MSLSRTEAKIIRNTIGRLRCAVRPDGSHREADTVRAALRGPAAIYVDTWIIGALECLLDEARDLELGESLSRL